MTNKIIKKINHIGIDVKDIKRSIRFYTQILGCSLMEQLISPNSKKNIAFIKAGEEIIEFIKYADESQKRENEGSISHICLEVGDIYEAIKKVSKYPGIQLLNDEPRKFKGQLIFFFFDLMMKELNLFNL